ncbi:MAG: hypothetical protein PHZ04_04915 [Patescibacteria group bacterium]|nr:hypothetical protein [Patescibacteria group bacterium]
MEKRIIKTKLKHQAKNLSWRIVTTVILTLTAIITVYVYVAFVEPSVGPTDSDQDFTQNILGANNADNDFDSSSVATNKDGSIVERLEYITNRMTTQGQWYSTECGESTTSTQTTCYVDDTARYLTTDLCNEAKENQCFVPTDNSYYAFGSECADSTTTTKTNCYVDDTAKYVDADACSAASNTGYCYMNTATFSAMDADLAAANIKPSITSLGLLEALVLGVEQERARPVGLIGVLLEQLVLIHAHTWGSSGGKLRLIPVLAEWGVVI